MGFNLINLLIICKISKIFLEYIKIDLFIYRNDWNNIIIFYK